MRALSLATASKKHHGTGTEPTGSPIKPVNETLDVPSLSKSLDENMDMAAAVLISFGANFLPTTQTRSSRRLTLNLCLTMKHLAKFVSIPNAGGCSCKRSNETAVSLADPDFPLGDFITNMLKIEMSPKTTTFLTDLQMRLPNIDNMQPFNGGLLKKANDNSVVDRKARVTISVSLPQYDGTKS